MKKPSKFETWFRTFLEEKDLETVEFITTIGRHIFTYDNYDVAEWIISNLSPADQAAVKKKIVYIDFKNGDVNHFLEYMGKGFAEVLAQEEEGKMKPSDSKKAWSAHYSERRGELMVLDAEGVQLFSINGEEIFENGVDQMDDHDREEWLRENYSEEIDDILESRA